MGYVRASFVSMVYISKANFRLVIGTATGGSIESEICSIVAELRKSFLLYFSSPKVIECTITDLTSQWR